MPNSRISIFIFLLLSIVFVAQCIHFFNHTLDDPFISFRYADNFASGNGLVYNKGEYVEGFSNPTWTLIMSFFSFIGLSDGEMYLLWCSKILGIICGILILYVLFFVARKYFSQPFVGPLSAFLLAGSPYFSLWSLSGLETTMFAFILLITVIKFIKEYQSGTNHYTSSVLLFILYMTRPEGGILFIPLLIMVYLRTREPCSISRKSSFISLASPFLIGIILVTLTRLLYYGDILPNTYYAKTYGGINQIISGFFYWLYGLLNTCIHPYFVILVVISLILSRKSRSFMCLIYVFIFYSIFIMYVGGDWMPGFRFMVHIMPIMMLVVSISISQLLEIINRRKISSTVCYAFLIFTIIILCAGHINQFRHIDRQYSIFESGYTTLSGESMVMSDYLNIGRKLRIITKESDYVALGEAGLIPYIGKMKIIDCFGLMDKHIGKMKGSLHYKFDAVYVLGRQPEYILILGKINETGELESKYLYSRMLFASDKFKTDYALHTVEGQFLLYKKRQGYNKAPFT